MERLRGRQHAKRRRVARDRKQWVNLLFAGCGFIEAGCALSPQDWFHIAVRPCADPAALGEVSRFDRLGKAHAERAAPKRGLARLEKEIVELASIAELYASSAGPKRPTHAL